MKKLLLILMLAIFTIGYTQNHSNIWYFGHNAGLDFNSGDPVVLTNGELSTDEGCASISTTDGTLLFYTDGITVYNSQHNVMVNGTGLLGDASSSQSAIIVPKPCAPNIYYIFTTAQVGLEAGLRYSEVDMEMAGGLGAVTNNKNILLTTPVCEKITAVPKADGTGFWVLTHGFGNNQFLAYSVTPDGVSLSPVLSNSGSAIIQQISTIGCLTPSHDGTKLVCSNWVQNTELFDFDPMSGVVSNGQVLDPAPFGFGAEFSPSGNVLYISTGNGNTTDLVQYDLTAPDIPASAFFLGTTATWFGALQLAPDGKIYIANSYSPNLYAINNPDVLGTGCGYTINAITLPNEVFFGLPQEILLRPAVSIDVTAQDVCLGNPTVFGVAACQPITSVIWDFGDGTTSTDMAPLHAYAAPGSYTVIVTAQIANTSVEQTYQVTVFDTPVANEIPDQTVCGNAGMMYNLAQNDAALWGLQASNFFIREYYGSLEDAQAHTNPLAINYPLLAGLNTFYAGVFNPLNPTCYAVETFTVNLTTAPVLPVVPNLQSCDSAPADGFTSFNLTQQDAALLAGQTGSTVAYYTSQANAEAGTSAIIIPAVFTNTVNPQTIYAAVTTVAGCESYTTFTVSTIPTYVLPVVPNLQNCDTAPVDGFTQFNLTQQDAALLSGQTGSTVIYYTSQANAEAGTSPITTPNAFTNTVNPQTIYVAVTTAAGCQSYTTFTVSTIPTYVLPVVPNLQNCDTAPADGFTSFNLTQQDTALLAGQTGSTVAYYTSQANAETGISPITTPAAFINTVNPQTIYAAVTNAAGCQSFTTFTVNATAPPALPVVPNLQSCDTAPADGFAAFNLTQQDAALLAGQTGSTVTYYTSQANAEAGTSPIVTPAAFINTVNPQTIYAAVTTVAGCQSYTTFTVNVMAIPAVVSLPDIQLCDDTVADGFTSFNLSQQDAALLAGQTGVTIAYHISQADADADNNPIANPANFVNTDGTQIIYVRVSNATCYATTSFTIIVNPLPIVDNISPVTACDEYILPALSPGNNYYTGPGATGTQLAAGSVLTANQTVYINAVNGICSAESSFTIAITPTPLLHLNTPIVGACVDNSYILTAVFADEEDIYNPDNVSFTWANTADEALILGTLQDVAITDAGTYHLTVTPSGGSCPAEAFIVVEDTSCAVQRGISPGDANDNNYFDLSRLDIKKLSIFNRYGLEVYTSNNYKKEWDGQNNNGHELPTGTYFYMFERANGESKTGWIYINRQN